MSSYRPPADLSGHGAPRGVRRLGGRRQHRAETSAKNPLQLGATFWHFRRQSRVTSPPIWAQNLFLPPLWALAKVFGVLLLRPLGQPVLGA